MSVLWIFFSPHGTYLKRVDIPPPPPKYPVKRKESKEIPPNACGIIAFLFLVRQVRLQNGRVLVGTLQFCDCSRYHDGISTRASHERTAPHTLGSIRSTTLKKKATLKTPGKQDSPVWRTTFGETEYQQHLLRTWK